MRPMDFAMRTTANKLVDYLCEDPENHMQSMFDKLDAISPDALFPSQRDAFRRVIKDKNNMYDLIMRVMALNPAVRNDLLKAFMVEGNFIAWGKQEKAREKYGCNIPWAILLDPTRVSLLHISRCRPPP